MYVYLGIFLLAVSMVADVTEARNVIPSLEFKTWNKKKSFYCFEPYCIYIYGVPDSATVIY